MVMKRRALVTGGAGYIGSHTVVELVHAGFEVVVVDNLCNSSREAVYRVEDITKTSIPFYEADVRDQEVLDEIFETYHIDSVIHFAGLKAVGESVENPLRYYRSNLDSTMTLLERMAAYDVKTLVFSSSATVYGDPQHLPITENAPLSATNPYGRTKLMIEQMLEDTVRSGGDWNITSLRYFNPIGAHKSGRIGEDPHDIPNNLLPYIAQVAVGLRERLHVYGSDYETPDGTGVRDYIHVVDLAKAHVAALKRAPHPGEYKVYNLGTSHGTSVLEMLKAFEKACGRSLPYKIVGRRPGDIATCYADPTLAHLELGWKAVHDIAEACADAWRWQSRNPEGYATSEPMHADVEILAANA
ncbi:UDP-glucose 4-epimerase GalE [Candidatus Saccharibacteria bacterium]|nr:UDP-glucose 4-epimerase GalE [Candidatus Saccharibacteria bacterium]